MLEHDPRTEWSFSSISHIQGGLLSLHKIPTLHGEADGAASSRTTVETLTDHSLSPQSGWVQSMMRRRSWSVIPKHAGIDYISSSTSEWSPMYEVIGSYNLISHEEHALAHLFEAMSRPKQRERSSPKDSKMLFSTCASGKLYRKILKSISRSCFSLIINFFTYSTVLQPPCLRPLEFSLCSLSPCPNPYQSFLLAS